MLGIISNASVYRISYSIGLPICRIERVLFSVPWHRRFFVVDIGRQNRTTPVLHRPQNQKKKKKWNIFAKYY